MLLHRYLSRLPLADGFHALMSDPTFLPVGHSAAGEEGEEEETQHEPQQANEIGKIKENEQKTCGSRNKDDDDDVGTKTMTMMMMMMMMMYDRHDDDDDDYAVPLSRFTRI